MRSLQPVSLSNNAVGCTAEEKALVNQWMEYRLTRIDPCDNDVRSVQAILKVTLFVLVVIVITVTSCIVAIVYVFAVYSSAYKSHKNDDIQQTLEMYRDFEHVCFQVSVALSTMRIYELEL